uniref:Uncharacterized protein n=1 Tax=Anguilla anguilla TaxID=7936 RepID=A0A0E9TDE0_ANGAN
MIVIILSMIVPHSWCLCPHCTLH